MGFTHPEFSQNLIQQYSLDTRSPLVKCVLPLFVPSHVLRRPFAETDERRMHQLDRDSIGICGALSQREHEFIPTCMQRAHCPAGLLSCSQLLMPRKSGSRAALASLSRRLHVFSAAVVLPAAAHVPLPPKFIRLATGALPRPLPFPGSPESRLPATGRAPVAVRTLALGRALAVCQCRHLQQRTTSEWRWRRPHRLHRHLHRGRRNLSLPQRQYRQRRHTALPTRRENA